MTFEEWLMQTGKDWHLTEKIAMRSAWEAGRAAMGGELAKKLESEDEFMRGLIHSGHFAATIVRKAIR